MSPSGMVTLALGTVVGNFSGYIIGEAGGDVLAGGVVVHALRVDAGEGERA